MTIEEKAKELCVQHGVKLVYLTKFGSRLYGTNSESSDEDYKGVFIDSVENLVIGNNTKNITFTTGGNNSRNTHDDVDISLWSLQYWLNLLKSGDTNAYDLLYSFTNKECVVFDELDKEIFESPETFIDVRTNKAYVSYAYAQAKKYGIKGSRIANLKNILKYLQDNVKEEDLETTRMGVLFDDILNNYKDTSTCFVEVKPTGSRIMYINGKGFDDSVKVSESIRRLSETFEKYGSRARDAEQNKGVDWKAVSHTVRCIRQVQQLIKERTITFPLASKDELKGIKYGHLTWKECQELIEDGLDDVHNTLDSVPKNNKVSEVHNNYILKMYGMEG